MIFVTGVGRSGTSSVARVIHESGIACMGHVWPKPDEDNPQGYWEDLEVRHRFIQDILSGKCSSWMNSVKKYHEHYECSAKLLGFKHPLLCAVYRDTWERLKPAAIFCCHRTKDQIIASMLRKSMHRKGYASLEDATTLYKDRMRDIKKNLAGLEFVKHLDFTEYKTDEWILNEVVTFLERRK